MRLNVLLLFIFSFLYSCNRSEIQIEDSLKSDFANHQESLNTVIRHVVNTYYDKDVTKKLNRLQFVLGKRTYQKRNIFSDTYISSELKNTSVVFINFEKNSICLDKYQFDLVRFKLDVKQSTFQYYYVYEFCPLSSANVNGPNFKSIQLDSNWSIQIEKS